MGIGVHVSSCNTTGFSSIQTTGSLAESGLSYNPSTSSMRAMYSSSSFATHHFFFPPRLQIVAFEQHSYGIWGACIFMQHHRLLVDTNHRLTCRKRSFIQPQHVLHAGDVLLIQLRHAPLFFPATASDRGFRAALVWYLGCMYLHATPPASRRYKPPAHLPKAVFHTTPARPPCGRCTPHPASPRTTFFSRHGFRSWLSSSTRMVSRPTGDN